MKLPLPEPFVGVKESRTLDSWDTFEFYTADQMRKYAAAAYRAGQEEMRERAAESCGKIAEEAWATYKGRMPGLEKGRAYNPHDQGRSDGAAECESAIRSLPIDRTTDPVYEGNK